MDSDTNIRDEKFNRIISTILTAGVALAVIVVLFGASLYLLRHGQQHPTFHVFEGEPNELKQIAGIIENSLALKGRGIIQLGLLILMATPVMRVAFAAAAYLATGDRMYFAFSLAVFCLLTISIFS